MSADWSFELELPEGSREQTCDAIRTIARILRGSELGFEDRDGRVRSSVQQRLLTLDQILESVTLANLENMTLSGRWPIRVQIGGDPDCIKHAWPWRPPGMKTVKLCCGAPNLRPSYPGESRKSMLPQSRSIWRELGHAIGSRWGFVFDDNECDWMLGQLEFKEVAGKALLLTYEQVIPVPIADRVCKIAARHGLTVPGVGLPWGRWISHLRSFHETDEYGELNRVLAREFRWEE